MTHAATGTTPPPIHVVAIMQPYFLPYIGYFQLIHAVDAFVVYDNIQYTKKGWINRNRMLVNHAPATFSVPVAKGSDYADIRDRQVAAAFDAPRMVRQFAQAYRPAPYVDETMPLVEQVLGHPPSDLFTFVHASLLATCAHLGIDTPIRVSSTIDTDHTLRGDERVRAICHACEATRYINPIGGTDLYCADTFAADGLELAFLRSRPVEYPQLGGPFVPWLSIVDVLMFNGVDGTRRLLDEFDLVDGEQNPWGVQG